MLSVGKELRVMMVNARIMIMRVESMLREDDADSIVLEAVQCNTSWHECHHLKTAGIRESPYRKRCLTRCSYSTSESIRIEGSGGMWIHRFTVQYLVF
ncbi:hypothetical protein Mapa_007763 [Marchantia paleacea]|nr:hypothetical protein Mapa_007763 [Marchantia paleacea]